MLTLSFPSSRAPESFLVPLVVRRSSLHAGQPSPPPATQTRPLTIPNRHRPPCAPANHRPGRFISVVPLPCFEAEGKSDSTVAAPPKFGHLEPSSATNKELRQPMNHTRAVGFPIPPETAPDDHLPCFRLSLKLVAVATVPVATGQAESSPTLVFEPPLHSNPICATFSFNSARNLTRHAPPVFGPNLRPITRRLCRPLPATATQPESPLASLDNSPNLPCVSHVPARSKNRRTPSVSPPLFWPMLKTGELELLLPSSLATVGRRERPSSLP